MSGACAHERRIDGPYRCADCGVEMCTDCGSAPKWWHSDSSYCRRCSLKGGQRGAFEIDPDKLLVLVGGDVAECERLLRLLAWDW